MMHLSHHFLLRVYHVPGAMFASGDAAVTKANKPGPLWEADWGCTAGARSGGDQVAGRSKR